MSEFPPIIVNGLPIEQFWKEETKKELAVPPKSYKHRLGRYNRHEIIIGKNGYWVDRITVIKHPVKKP